MPFRAARIAVKEPFVVRNSPWRWLAFALIAFLFVAAGIAFVITPETFEGRRSATFVYVIGWLLIVGFGAGFVVCLREALSRQPRLLIDEEGIEDRRLGLGKIPWTEILDVRLVRMQRVPLLALFLRDPGPWLEKLPRFRRWAARTNQRMGLSPFVISLAATKQKAGKVHDLVREHLARLQPTRP